MTSIEPNRPAAGRTEAALRQEVVRVCRTLYERNLTIGFEGNVSVRLADGRLLTTPSGRHKGFLDPAELVIVNKAGRPEGGPLKPTSELPMHLACYQARPGVGAVIHAHPPLTTALTVAGVALDRPVLPEVVVTLPPIPLAKLAAPATAEGAEAIKNLVGGHDVIVLDRHGSLTLGPDLLTALARLEKLEHLARVVATATMLGRVKTLPAAKHKQLVDLGRSLGFLK